jgi:LacI family transcriptional regulator
MQNTPRINMRDLAKLAGVSVMTVSRALRNHPKISTNTKERINRLAIEKGYMVNPLVAAQMASIRARKIVRYKATLGLLISDPPEGIWKGTESVIEGVIETCNEIGFGCDTFDLKDRSLTAKRLDKILKTRDIHGLIEAPTLMDFSNYEIDFSRLIYVSTNAGFLPQKFHRVNHDYYGNMDMLMRILYANGYRRPGLLVARDLDSRINHLWTSRYLAFQQTENLGKIPPYMPDNRLAYKKSAFMTWYKEFKPDILIASSQEVYEDDFYKKAGLRIPQDIEMVKININDMKKGFSGINTNSKEVGASCVRLMAQLMYQNEYGIPEKPISILIPGSWTSGTLCPTLDKLTFEEMNL